MNSLLLGQPHLMDLFVSSGSRLLLLTPRLNSARAAGLSSRGFPRKGPYLQRCNSASTLCSNSSRVLPMRLRLAARLTSAFDTSSSPRRTSWSHAFFLSAFVFDNVVPEAFCAWLTLVRLSLPCVLFELSLAVFALAIAGARLVAAGVAALLQLSLRRRTVRRLP